jgi:excisionase family DNA binding protein
VPDLNGYLLASEAAAKLKVSPKTVTRWANEGKLPYITTLGGHRRYDPGEIDAIVEGHTFRPPERQPQPEPAP